MTRVFIDGSSGTTGLRIRDRLAAREDLELLTLPEALRKDPAAKKELMNKSDIVFLCLPDDAAREAVTLVENPDTVVIDTSTAHRTAPGWVYGFPELSPKQEQAVKTARRIANPGCHASGFIVLTAPLVAAGILPPETALSCFSITGYSGGGKSMIADYEGAERDALLNYPRQYGLAQKHKHLPEMTTISGISVTPVFIPVVAPFYSGMEVTVPVFKKDLAPGADMDAIRSVYRANYGGRIVTYRDDAGENGFLSSGTLAGTDRMEVAVFGNEERILLTSRYDNLGKGASGAAVECMNLVLGLAPETGLVL